MSTVQLRFDNDETLDVETGNLSVGCEKCGQLFHIPLNSIDRARVALKEKEKHMTEFHTEGTQS